MQCFFDVSVSALMTVSTAWFFHVRKCRPTTFCCKVVVVFANKPALLFVFALPGLYSLIQCVLRFRRSRLLEMWHLLDFPLLYVECLLIWERTNEFGFFKGHLQANFSAHYLSISICCITLRSLSISKLRSSKYCL